MSRKMRKILVIDNYDSFTYNLVHYLRELKTDVTVFRNDEFELEDIENFDKIVLSPGPGIPSEAGLLLKVIERYAATKSILGVCLGHQAIAEVFGGKLINLEEVFHGVASNIEVVVDDEILFKNIENKFEVGRYHSWIVENPMPQVLQLTSIDENGHIMSLRHREFDVRGMQFHPESVLTPNGKKILENWIGE